MPTYEERQAPVTVPADLVSELWQQIILARDDAFNARLQAERREENLTALLGRLKEAGFAEHLPTLEEVQAEWLNTPSPMPELQAWIKDRR